MNDQDTKTRHKFIIIFLGFHPFFPPENFSVEKCGGNIILKKNHKNY